MTLTMCTRLIPCLDLSDGRVVKGTNFQNLRDMGDPVELAQRYQDAGADEIILLDISATNESRGTFFHKMEAIADSVSIPVGIGGGIKTVQDASDALNAGAEKVGINSAAVVNPEIITELSSRFGAQCVMVSIDAAKEEGRTLEQMGQFEHQLPAWEVVVKSGTTGTSLNAVLWAKQAAELGAGEILLTSIDRDGTRDGYDIELCKAVRSVVDVPVIASGGAGAIQHVLDLYRAEAADAALLAGILHDGTTTVEAIKQALIEDGQIVRSR